MSRPLVQASAIFAHGVALHTTDHLRQTRGIGALAPEVMIGGTLVVVAAVVTLVMALRGHERAPLVATVFGFATAIGVTASHIAPYLGPLSDPYTALNLDAYSWAVMLFEVGAALGLGIV